MQSIWKCQWIGSKLTKKIIYVWSKYLALIDATTNKVLSNKTNCVAINKSKLIKEHEVLLSNREVIFVVKENRRNIYEFLVALFINLNGLFKVFIY